MSTYMYMHAHTIDLTKHRNSEEKKIQARIKKQGTLKVHLILFKK